MKNPNDRTVSSAAIEPLAVNESELRRMLGNTPLSATTLWRMEQRKQIQRVPGIKARVYTLASVRKLISGHVDAAA